jgi:alpha/beta superfamily hydrolase
MSEFDFSFLSPCPCNGLILNSDGDTQENHQTRKALAEKINDQKDVKIKYAALKNTNPQFIGNLPLLYKNLREYIATQKDKENKLI